jgi:hypothetical protein
MMTAVIVAGAAMVMPVPAVIRDAKDALHCAHGAADPGPDGTADDPADRAGDTMAFVGAFAGAPDKTLGMAGAGQRRESESDDRRGAMQPEA